MPTHTRALLTTAGQVAAIACLGCSTSVLTTLSRRHSEYAADAAYSYWPAVVVVTAEVCKAVLSLGLLSCGAVKKHGHDPPRITWPPASTVPPLAGLAVLYAAQNNLLFAAMRVVNLATYQVLISLRIPVTAGLMWAVHGRTFSRRQQAAIVALVVGVILTQVDVGLLLSTDDPASAFALTSTGAAYMAATVACASLASVLNETMLKDEARGSLHAQNCVLYACGCGVNAGLLGRRGLARVTGHGVASLFTGFNVYTWALVGSLTFLGLATASVLKHADNMVRSLGYVGSIVLASAVSAAWLSTGLTPTFTAGAGMACAGIVAYMSDGAGRAAAGGKTGATAALPVHVVSPPSTRWPVPGKAASSQS